MSEFKMPSLGADMDAGTLVEWIKKPGDAVKRGDIIASVETAKGVIEIECFEDGILDEIFFQAGQEVPVGHVLATIVSKEEYGKPKAAPAPKPSEPVKIEKIPEAAITEAAKESAAKVVEELKASITPPAVEGARVRISPLASRMAIELGVDLRQVKGTGPGGAIQRADIERAAAAQKAVSAAQPVEPVKAPPVAETKPVEAITPPVAPPVAPPVPVERPPEVLPEQKKPLDFQTAMRQAIAAAMSRSNRDIPHYYLETSIDMTNALAWLEEENLKRTIRDRLLPVVILLKAVAKSLTEVPELNGFWVDGGHQVSEAIHIGFAIALRQGGLLTPAIHDADMKTFDELREAMNDLIIRTRSNRLRSSELTDATITVTSLGDRGVEKVFGVIYPPQVALVGLGKITPQPWAVNGALCVRPILVATLAGDHRATDGHKGGLFLEALNRNLQEVEKL
jgi:pyruvate dehydrogenase E2 component (dihydrolipoamide acetyltransferase)